MLKRRFMNNHTYDYNDYMTIETIDDVLVTFPRVVQYSINGGSWRHARQVDLKAGMLCSVKCIMEQDGNIFGRIEFRGGTFNLLGNCLSLIFGDSAKYENDITGYEGILSHTFELTSVCNVSKDFLPATTLVDNCYDSMFRDCKNLTTAPALPATTLANSCYNHMFSNCTSLTESPTLPATTLADSCYRYMFRDCKNLTTAPALPATTLANSCYYGMFNGCTSLTTAPVLPAKTLAFNCYISMFYRCTKLNYIKAMFTMLPSASYTLDWVYGVASTGTFVKNKNANWEVTGVNGVPNGWIIQKV